MGRTLYLRMAPSRAFNCDRWHDRARITLYPCTKLLVAWLHSFMRSAGVVNCAEVNVCCVQGSVFAGGGIIIGERWKVGGGCSRG
jgi:hypothetical protein